MRAPAKMRLVLMAVLTTVLLFGTGCTRCCPITAQPSGAPADQVFQEFLLGGQPVTAWLVRYSAVPKYGLSITGDVPARPQRALDQGALRSAGGRDLRAVSSGLAALSRHPDLQLAGGNRHARRRRLLRPIARDPPKVVKEVRIGAWAGRRRAGVSGA